MGGGSWSHKDWTSYANSSNVMNKSAHEFYSKHLVQALDPKGITMRESRDSTEHPESTAVIVGLDVTGSMAAVLQEMARHGLHQLCTSLYEQRPVKDPQIMCMGIGDVECDHSPFQVSQFESDIRIAKQLEQLYLEGGGGGNSHESYSLACLFAAEKTSIDCYEKRNKKGYLFTIGDEQPTPDFKAKDLERALGYVPEGPYKTKDLLKRVSKSFEVYHIIVEEGSNGQDSKVHKAWEDILGQRAIHLPNHKKLAQTIVSAIQLQEGKKIDDVAKCWDDDTAAIIHKSLGKYNRLIDLDV